MQRVHRRICNRVWFREVGQGPIRTLRAGCHPQRVPLGGLPAVWCFGGAFAPLSTNTSASWKICGFVGRVGRGCQISCGASAASSRVLIRRSSLARSPDRLSMCMRRWQLGQSARDRRLRNTSQIGQNVMPGMASPWAQSSTGSGWLTAWNLRCGLCIGHISGWRAPAG